MAAALALAGCRREDVRSVTVKMRGFSETDKPAIVAALSKYNGIRRDSFEWDAAAGTLTLRYDSMQIAQTNIRMAIESAGVRVEYPEKKNGRAGH